jgi:AraC-like DNA-binding protein
MFLHLCRSTLLTRTIIFKIYYPDSEYYRMENFLSNILLIAVFQGFLLITVIFLWKKNSTANKIFSLFICFITLNLLYIYCTIQEVDEYLIAILDFIPSFFTGPIIYIYIKTLTTASVKIKIKKLLHLTPLLISLIFTIFTYIGLLNFPTFYKIENSINVIFIVFEDIYTLVYLLISYNIIRKFQKKLPLFFSNIFNLRLKYLLFLVIVLFIFRTYSIIEISITIMGIQIPEVIDSLSLLFEAAFIYVISYFVLSQKEIFDDIVDLTKEKSPISSTKYEKTKLDQTAIDKYYIQLIDFMNKNEPFLQNTLTLKDLADSLRIPSYQLSQVINTCTGKNFYTFINTYRVEKVCRMLKEKNKKNMLEVAFSSGFNSKTSFNYVFKKLIGITPTEYKKRSNIILR